MQSQRRRSVCKERGSTLFVAAHGFTSQTYVWEPMWELGSANAPSIGAIARQTIGPDPGQRVTELTSFAARRLAPRRFGAVWRLGAIELSKSAWFGAPVSITRRQNPNPPDHKMNAAAPDSSRGFATYGLDRNVKVASADWNHPSRLQGH